MILRASYFQKSFYTHFVANTSRGAVRNRISWFIKIEEEAHPSYFGLGEAGPLPALSMDDYPDFEERLSAIVTCFNEGKIDGSTLHGTTVDSIWYILKRTLPQIEEYPSLLFAFETALLDWVHGGARVIFKNQFIRGKPIPINGLIWMNEADRMLRQAEAKIREGFDVLKLKVGQANFEEELRIIQHIREQHSSKEIVLRLDANGAFEAHEAWDKLDALSHFEIHSIEQPMSPGSMKTAGLCAHSPIPIALDEELIGLVSDEDKEHLLKRLNPSFIILKPTLHGGLYGCKRWVEIADSLGVGWWMTSALESSIGLNAIAQFVAEFDFSLAQGLGTGSIYKNNFTSPLFVNKGRLAYDSRGMWELG